MSKGKASLFLVPSMLGDEAEASIPAYVKDIVKDIECFVVENERSARRFLRKIGYDKDFDAVTMHLLDKHTDPAEVPAFLKELRSGKDTAVISEAGAPGVADPGALVVAQAHRDGLRVVPLVGPNSILMALMASGLNGQQFSFHGYLPIKEPARSNTIRELETAMQKTGATQIFMEAPYRNNQLVKDLLKVCRPNTLLSIAVLLTTPGEFVKTLTIDNWKKQGRDLHKKPAIFLLGSDIFDHHVSN